MKIYFSVPQNTPYQRTFVQNCVEKLANSGFEVFIATNAFIKDQSAFEQTIEGNGKLLASDETNSGKLSKSTYARQVFAENYARLADAHTLVALLDGSQVDDRVACEIGIFYGLMRSDPSKKGILGLVTDARCLRRRDSTFGVNIFTLGTLEEVGEVVEDLNWVIKTLLRWDK
ncbi:MAG: nucleoside 2-deoxyribosyltransferase [Pelolinea sp.]|nr:nucleoside 2-deoxyribosyltransferase [Pelolinea sp.]